MQEAQQLTTGRQPGNNLAKSLLGGVLVAVALALAGWAIWSKRTQLHHGLDRLPVAALVLALLAGIGAVASTLFVWRAILAGLGVKLPLKDSARVYFIGQLGKYVPGSVWPVLAQMELARRHHVDRKTMLAGSTLAIILNTAVGALVACALIPFVSAGTFHRFWWLLPCAPVLLVAMHPKFSLGGVNWLLRRLGRGTVPATLTVRDELKAVGWGLVSWAFLGVHVYAMVDGLGATGARAVAASVAAGCVAISAGILLIPVPAGAGVREVAFVATLTSVMTEPFALLVAILSRAVLVLVDVLLAGTIFAVSKLAPTPAGPE